MLTNTTRKGQRGNPTRIEFSDTFARLTVFARMRNDSNNRSRWLCFCTCGNIISVVGKNLLNGTTGSCGCLRVDTSRLLGEAKIKHGFARTRLYRIWTNMRERCSPNGNQSYGVRGIYVTSAWLDFMAFRSWALANGYGDSLTIERIDVNGIYEPSNCTWIPPARQARNRRDTVFLTAFGETKSRADWLDDERCVVGLGCLRSRLGRGVTPEQALSSTG